MRSLSHKQLYAMTREHMIAEIRSLRLELGSATRIINLVTETMHDGYIMQDEGCVIESKIDKYLEATKRIDEYEASSNPRP